MSTRRTDSRVARAKKATSQRGRRFVARVIVRFKRGVLDPQGQAVLAAAHSLGFPGVSEVRVGKIFELALTASNEKTARETVDALARDLLANPVIESFAVESLSPASPSG
jgi:phosphoribosylformylglycinamidine synthase